VQENAGVENAFFARIAFSTPAFSVPPPGRRAIGLSGLTVLEAELSL